MKLARLTKKQIIDLLKEQEAGSNTANLVRCHGGRSTVRKSTIAAPEIEENAIMKQDIGIAGGLNFRENVLLLNTQHNGFHA